jgi:hypothetical protein
LQLQLRRMHNRGLSVNSRSHDGGDHFSIERLRVSVFERLTLIHGHHGAGIHGGDRKGRQARRHRSDFMGPYVLNAMIQGKIQRLWTRRYAIWNMRKRTNYLSGLRSLSEGYRMRRGSTQVGINSRTVTRM